MTLPSKDVLLEWIRENPTSAGKREIARAFGLKGAERVILRDMLRELQDDGLLEKRRRAVRPAGRLPPTGIVIITGPDSMGDLLARPAEWPEDSPPPQILVHPRKADGALGAGDRLLAKLTPVQSEGHAYEARPIKKLTERARRMVGIFREGRNGMGRIEPIEKRAQKEWTVPAGQTDGAKDGDLVEAEGLQGPRLGLPRGRVIKRHGDPTAARQVSLMALVEHQIPYDFSPDVEAEARAAQPILALGSRTDLRDLPLITIDPADARDHDDAICALPDTDPGNPNGHIVWVAIADVAHYVTPGSALDREAQERGNSTYFPDRVSPMLPDLLSADLCSLIAEQDRPCLAVEMVLDDQGRKLRHRFVRGLMRSPAALAYEDVQAAIDGEPTPVAPSLTETVLRPLYNAYRAAQRAREYRQPLELDLPERRIELTEAGDVAHIGFRDRLDAHRLVEEFMILANVCAAETLEGQRARLLYRVHEEPNPDKLDALRETVGTVGLTLAKGQVLKTRHLNQLLAGARGTEHAETVAMSVLRSQTQAYYAQHNLGHFGLNLPRYAHFTSPIRRYADLVVHRALISALDLGDDGLREADIRVLDKTAEHISRTERRSMEAERDTVDRYLAAFMADREGAEFDGTVSGLSRAGIFVKLDDTGADGLIPISSLGTDYFRYDQKAMTLTGERSGQEIGMGQRARVRLLEASPISGGLIFELKALNGQALTQRRAGRASQRGKIPRGSFKKRGKGRARRG